MPYTKSRPGRNYQYDTSKDDYFDEPQRSAGRPLSLVFNVDSTVSMRNSDGVDQKNGITRMDRLNATVQHVLQHVASSDYAPEVEVAFVVFTEDVVLYTDFTNSCEITPDFFRGSHAHYTPCRGEFQNVNTKTVSYVYDDVEQELVVPHFDAFPVATQTHIGAGVIKSIELIENRKKALEKMGISFYVPIMVTVSDGNTHNNGIPEEEKQAQKDVYEHCFSKGNASNLIIPLFIGIGENANKKALEEYAKGYTRGLQIVTPNNETPSYTAMEQLIQRSLKKSISLNSWDSKTKAREQYNQSRWAEEYSVDQVMDDDD